MENVGLLLTVIGFYGASIETLKELGIYEV